MILDLSPAVSGSVHDFKLFKDHRLPRACQRFLKLMHKVIIGGDSAYEALPKLYPTWHCRINEKAKRNHPLTEEQKLNNTLKTKVRLLIEPVIRRLKIYRCCADRVRKMAASTHTRYWTLVAGLCNWDRAQTLGMQQIFGYPQESKDVNQE